MNASYYPLLNVYITEILPGAERIDTSRKSILNDLASYIAERVESSRDVNLIFICTHNSRRSHLGQLWAQVAANYFQLGINTFSGGTEATAFNVRAVAAMERAGFKISGLGEMNPRYKVSYGPDYPEMMAFSKVFDDPVNPQTGFAAIMTCSDADEACPVVPGADIRIPLYYEDPKDFDDTPLESKMYDERCQQIATEMFYLMSKVEMKR